MTISFHRDIGTAMGSSNGGTVGSGVQNVLNNLASFVRNFPTECHRHVIVVTFILRNKHQTNIQIEIQELEGGVRATGLLCLLGIGIGLGSLFIYKLYTRLFPKILLPPPTQTSGKIRRPNSGDLCCENLLPANGTACAGNAALAETPDSGISAGTAGTDNEPLPASIPDKYPLDTQLHRRRNTVAEWLARADLTTSDLVSEADYISDTYGNLKDAFKSLRSWRSSGYVSIDQMTGEGDVHGSGQRKRILSQQDPTCFRLDEDALSDGVLSITDHILVPSLVSENPEDEFDNTAADDLILGSDEHPFHASEKASSLPGRRRKLSIGSNRSADIPRIWLRRNHHSFGSDLSAASSGCTYRESLVSKGFSVDLGEDLTGIMTPPDGGTGMLDHWTMSSMDQLHKELRKIQEDISYMNDKVEVLLSKEDSVKPTQDLFSADEDEEENRRIMMEARSRRRRRSRSLSSVRSRSDSVGAEIEDELDAPDFIWDYHSDLALDQYDKPMFVVKRPCPVFSDDFVDLPADDLNLKATNAVNLEKRRTFKHPRSTEMNQTCIDSFRESVFDDEADFGVRGFESQSLHRGSVHVNSKCCNQKHVCSSSDVHDADLPVFPHLNHHICDCRACFPGVCFPDDIFGHVPPPCLSDVGSCCHEKMFLRRTLHSCSSCHVHRKGRPSSARTSKRYDRPLSSGHCNGCCSQSQSCACCQPCPAVHHCDPSPVLRCKSHDVAESKGWCRQHPSLTNHHETRVPQAPKPCFSDKMNSPKAINIENKVNIRDYLAQELGHHVCDKSPDMRRGFDLLNRLWGIASIRKIRNDNYCNLRAVLYQALVHNLPILAATGNFEHLVQKLAMAIDSGHSYLIDWKFGDQPVLSKEETVMKMTECLRILFEQVEAVAGMSNVMCREQYLLALLNHSPEMDHSLLEGLKILMMLKAIELFSEHAGNRNVPSFMLQLFGKGSSNSVESFFTSHINVIGNTRPMRAVELSLLGLALCVRIEVIRPSLFNKEGFIVHYPDEGADGFGKVHIIQEDQDWNHYSVPVMKYAL